MIYLNATDPYRILRLALSYFDHVRIEVQGAARHPLATVALAPTVHRIEDVARVITTC